MAPFADPLGSQSAIVMSGVREWLLLAADQSKAWQLIKAESLEAAHEIAASFPLHPYLNTVITPLADGQ